MPEPEPESEPAGGPRPGEAAEDEVPRSRQAWQRALQRGDTVVVAGKGTVGRLKTAPGRDGEVDLLTTKMHGRATRASELRPATAAEHAKAEAAFATVRAAWRHTARLAFSAAASPRLARRTSAVCPPVEHPPLQVLRLSPNAPRAGRRARSGG